MRGTNFDHVGRAFVSWSVVVTLLHMAPNSADGFFVTVSLVLQISTSLSSELNLSLPKDHDAQVFLFYALPKKPKEACAIMMTKKA